MKVSMSALAALAALQPALAFDSGAFSATGYAHGSTIGDLRRRGGAGLRSQQPAVATLLPPAATAAATGAGTLDGSWVERRRVNWWFNIFDENTSAHVLQVARAHRTALTGVVQWVQPGGFTVHGDANWCPPGTPVPCAGHVDLPPHAAMVSATRPLHELGLEVGVVFSFLPPAVFLMPPGSPAIDRAVDQLAATADTYNLTSLMVDFEGYSNTTGPNGTAIPAFGCTEAKAGLLADFLRKLAVRLHAQGRRLGMSIEMGCIIGPEPYWKLYAGAGVDYMMSMASTYYGTNVSFNRDWVQRELSAVPSSKLAVGMGVNPGGSQECVDIMKRGGSWGCPAWWGCPGAGQPNCTCPLGGAKGYNWTSPKFEAFARWVGESTPILELDLFRGDMVRANANPILDCVPPFAYEAMERFLAAAPVKTDDDDDNRLLAELGQDRRTEGAAAPLIAADLRLLSTIDSTAAASSAGAGLRYIVQARTYPSSPNDLVTTMRGGGVAVWRWNEDRRSEKAALLRVRTVALPGVPTEGQDSIGNLLVVVAMNPHSRELARACPALLTFCEVIEAR